MQLHSPAADDEIPHTRSASVINSRSGAHAGCRVGRMTATGSPWRVDRHLLAGEDALEDLRKGGSSLADRHRARHVQIVHRCTAPYNGPSTLTRQQALRRREHLALTTLPSPAGSEEVRLRLVEMMCGRMWTRQLGAMERQLKGDAFQSSAPTTSGRTRSCRARTNRLAFVDLHRRRPVGVLPMTMSAPASRPSAPGSAATRTASGRIRCPMREHDDDVRSGLAGCRYVLFDEVCLKRRAADLGRGGVVAAGDRVVGEDRDPDPTGLEDGRLPGGGEVLAGTGHLDAPLRHILDGLEQALAAGVANVVVGKRDVSMPALARPAMSFGRPRRRCPWCGRRVVGAGFSKFAIAMSAPEMSARNAPASPFAWPAAHPSRTPSNRRGVMSA